MRVYLDLQAIVSVDLDQLDKVLASRFQIDDADATTYASHYATLAPSAVDYPVPFGGVTETRQVIIVAYQDVTVKLAGTGSPALPVSIHEASDPADVLSDTQLYNQPGLVVWTGDVTSIHLANPSSTVEAKVFVALIGEAE